MMMKISSHRPSLMNLSTPDIFSITFQAERRKKSLVHAEDFRA